MAIIGISGKKQHGKDTVAKIIQYLAMQVKLAKHDMQVMDGGFSGTASATMAMDIFTSWPSPYREGFSGWQTKAFAGKLKEIVALLIGCTLEQLEDSKFKETELGDEWACYMIPGSPYDILYPLDIDIEWVSKGRGYIKRNLTPRMLLQLIGTECGRKIIHPNVWINATLADYKRQPHNGPTRDLKFPNWLITDVRFPNEVKAIKEAGGLVIRVNRIFPIMSSYRGKDGNTVLTGVDENGKIDLHESETALDSYSNFDDIIQNNGSIEDLRQEVLSFLKAFHII